MLLFKETLLIFSVICLACLVEPQRLPCRVLSKNAKLSVHLQAISKSRCKSLKDARMLGNDVHEVRTTFYRNLTFDLKIKRAKKTAYLVLIKSSKKKRMNFSCFRVLYLKSTRKISKRYTVTISCSEKYMNTEGSVQIYKRRKHKLGVQHDHRFRLVTAFKYQFQEPCTAYQPRVHIRKINGGVNVSSCHKKFNRMEFGLYNVKTERMEMPPVEPLDHCWVFFQNLTYGEYKGTVQIMSCSDCEDFLLTGEPCETIRYRSSTFTFGTKPTSCRDKPKLPDDELPLIQKDLSSKSKENKILVIYDADHSLHVGAVKSFCQLLSCLGKTIVTSDQIQNHGNKSFNSSMTDGFGTVIIVLSKGSFKKCENFSHASLNRIHDSQAARNCLDKLKDLVNDTEVLFVSFGYGLEFISDFHKYLSISRKNIFSLTREVQDPRVLNSRTKRELNLNSFLASIEVFRSLDQINSSRNDINERDAAQNFLQHVNRVMES